MTESKLLATLRAKLERFLRQMLPSGFEVLGERYRIRFDSTALLLQPLEWQEDKTILRILALVLKDVPRAGNEAMFEEFSAINDRMIFGKIYWLPDSPENKEVGMVLIEHNLLGEFLDYEELEVACKACGFSAADLDEQLKTRYGGKRYIDD